MLWRLSHHADERALPLADRHYSRQQPGTPQFVAPAPQIVLMTADERALWVSTWPKYVSHAWPGAWQCTMFRNEGAGLSSELILQAVAITRWRFGDPPPNGMITFIDESKIRHKRDPGRCFLRAGFVRLPERTKERNRIVLQLAPSRVPLAEVPLGAQRRLV